MTGTAKYYGVVETPSRAAGSRPQGLLALSPGGFAAGTITYSISTLAEVLHRGAIDAAYHRVQNLPSSRSRGAPEIGKIAAKKHRADHSDSHPYGTSAKPRAHGGAEHAALRNMVRQTILHGVAARSLHSQTPTGYQSGCDGYIYNSWTWYPRKGQWKRPFLPLPGPQLPRQQKPHLRSTTSGQLACGAII